MRKVILIAMILIFGALPASAEDNQDNMAFCQFLPVKEEALAGADYVPGVDVKGNPVVSADVKAGAKGFVDVIRIPVTVDIAQNLMQNLPQGTEMDAQIALVEIYKDSRVIMNGHDVTESAYAHCGKKPLNIEKAEVEINPNPGLVVEQAQEELPLPVEVEEKETIIWGEGY